MNAAAAPAPTAIEFEAALAKFVTEVTAFRKAYYGREKPEYVEAGGLWEAEYPVHVMRGGKRYLRIVIRSRSGENASVFCFVEVATGLVYKAAGWKCPAPHPRGSIYAADFKGYGVDHHGPHYLTH